MGSLYIACMCTVKHGLHRLQYMYCTQQPTVWAVGPYCSLLTSCYGYTHSIH